MGFLEMEYKRICSAKLAYKFHISKVSFWCDDDMIFQTEGQICILHKGCYLAKAKIGLSHEQQMIIGVEYRYKW